MAFADPRERVDGGTKENNAAQRRVVFYIENVFAFRANDPGAFAIPAWTRP